MPTYTPDARNEDRPQGGDRVRITAELRAIKSYAREIEEESLSKNLPAQKVHPTGSSGISTSSSSPTVNLSNGTFQHFRVTRDVTFSFSVPTLDSGFVPFFTLRLTNGGNHNVSWPSGTRWPNGIPPVLTSNGSDMLVFYRYYPNGPWEGVLIGSDIKEPN